MANIEDILQNLGLKKNEATVYVNLLQLGKATAYEVAKQSGLKRPTVYVLLDELRIRGLVNKIPYPKKQVFIAKHPEDLIRDAENKLDVVVRALPTLLALTYGQEKPSISFFEGMRGIKNLLDYGLERVENAEMVGYYAHTEHTSPEMNDLFSKYNDKLRKRNIRIRGLVPDHPSLENYRKCDDVFGRTMKVIPLNEYSSDVSVDIGPNFVRVLLLNDLQGVVIEHRGLSLALKQIFEMLWGRLAVE